MKHGMPRKPVLREKKILKRLGHDPKSFLRLKKEKNHYEFVEVYSGMVMNIDRTDGAWKEVA